MKLKTPNNHFYLSDLNDNKKRNLASFLFSDFIQANLKPSNNKPETC